MHSAWNHNIQYHRLVLACVPQACARALDVGCGTGLLARQLSNLCGQVVGIDLDPNVIAEARSTEPQHMQVSFIDGDVLTYPFEPASFAFLSAVATLHHLPLEPALARFRQLLAPGGVLVIVGLYRADGFMDALYAMVGFAASAVLRRVRSFHEVAAPMQAPQQNLREIGVAARNVLPGSALRRRLLFRYSLIWQKPFEKGVDQTL